MWTSEAELSGCSELALLLQVQRTTETELWMLLQ